MRRINRDTNPWLARVRVNGKDRSAVFPTKAEATVWEAQVKAGQEPPAAPAREALTVEAACRRWARDARAGLVDTNAGTEYAPSSIELHWRMHRRVVIPYMGDTLITDVDQAMVLGLRDHATKMRSRQYGVGAVNSLRVVMRMLLERKVLDSNPCDKLPKRKITREAPKFLQPDELASLLEHADQMDDQIAVAVHIAAGGALRRGEVMALRVQDVVRGRGVWIRRSMDATGAVGPPKHRHERFVPLPDEVLERMEPWTAGKGPDEQVVGLINRKALAKWWPDQAMNFRMLRHTRASLWLSGAPGVPGLSVHAVAKLLGHGGDRPDATLVLRLYGHALDQDTDRAAVVAAATYAPTRSLQPSNLPPVRP